MDGVIALISAFFCILCYSTAFLVNDKLRLPLMLLGNLFGIVYISLVFK